MKRILLHTLLFLSIISYAQPPRKFYTRFGGNGIDVGYGVKQTLDGHYIVTGSTSSLGYGNTDVMLTKVDSMGWVRWTKTFGGFNNDIGKSIILLPDSGFVIAGYTNSFGAGGYDVYVIRTDKYGNLIWQNTFGGLDWDFGYDVVRSPDGHFIVCGSTYSMGYGKTDGYIVKFNYNTGALIWQKTFGGVEDDEFREIKLTSDSKYVLVGKTNSYLDIKGDAWLLKLGLLGDSITSKTYGAVNKVDFFNSIVERPNNRYAIAGGSETYSTGKLDAYFMETDPQGNAFWFNNDGAAAYDEEVFKIVNSNSYAFGMMIIYTTQTITGNNKDLKKGLINGGFFTGNTGTFGFPDNDEVFGLCNTRDKGFVAVGYTKSLNAQQDDVFLIKLDSLGAIGQTDGVVSIGNSPMKENQRINVFPTVTNSFINVLSVKESNNPYLIIHNSIGEMIFKTTLTDKLQKIDLSSFSQGVYYLSVTESSFIETFKVVKIE